MSRERKNENKVYIDEDDEKVCTRMRTCKFFNKLLKNICIFNFLDFFSFSSYFHTHTYIVCIYTISL